MVLTKLQESWTGTYAAEILFFIFKVSESMLEPTIRLYILDSVCLKMYPGQDTCEHLADLPGREHTVQTTAASYLMFYKLLLNLPAMLLVLLCGAWSDRTGRKLPVLVTCFGSILAVLLYMLSGYVRGQAPFLPLVLVGAALRGVFGRSAVMTMSLHSYVSDISSRELRTRKMSCLSAMSHFGYLTGCMAAGGLLEVFGFQQVFAVVIGLQSTCILVAVLCMRETVSSAPEKDDPEGIKDTESSQESSCKLAPLKESFGVLVKRRKGKLRKLLAVAFLTIIIQQTCKSGEIDITLLYVSRSPLSWRKSEYGYFLGFDYASLGIFAFFVLPLLIRCLHLHDLSLIAIGVTFKVIRTLIMTFSDRTWMVFLSASLGGPNSFTSAGVKSLISKTVFEDELGKTFSLLSCAETMANLVGSVIFANVYSITLDLFPGFAFALEAILYFGVFIMILITIAVRKKDLQTKETLLKGDKSSVYNKGYGTMDVTIRDSDNEVVAIVTEISDKEKHDEIRNSFCETIQILRDKEKPKGTGLSVS